MHSSPVQHGVFRTGIEQVLWQPGLDRNQLRRRALWSCLAPDATLYALAGAMAILIGGANKPMLLVAVAAGGVLIVVAVLMARYDYLRYGHDLSDRSAAWRIDRGQGEWFFRANDFTDRGTASANTAAQIIDAVHLSNTGPATEWLDGTLLSVLHQLAWDALVQLYLAPSAHDDLRSVVVRLNLVAARIRDANRQLYHATATTGTEDLLVRLTALHDVLTEEAMP